MMIKIIPFIVYGCLVSVLSGTAAEPDPNFHLYLLFGQSNMAGGCNHATVAAQSIDRQPADCDTTSRVKVLAWGDCKNKESGPCPDLVLNREYDQWYTAFPPYHKCGEGIGPADYFGKTLLDSIRENIKIGFIPCALSGQSIAVFEKGSNAPIDEYTQPYRGSQRLKNNAYGWMKERCQLAQKSGVIKGVLFHQGEANTGDASWVDKVKGIFDNLKQDLNLHENIPIVVGELLKDNGACCSSHNPLVNRLASEYPNCGLASSEGLKMRPADQWKAHFSCPGIRELGKRFATVFLKMANNDYLPRKGTVPVIQPKTAKGPIGPFRFWNDGVRIFTINGRFMAEVDSLARTDKWRYIKKEKVFIMYRK